MFQAYTYYLYHVPTGKKYYGVRWGNKVEAEQDLWNKYFSSSDLVEELIKTYGKESFTAEVRKKFDTGEEARYWEDRVLHKLKAPEKENWLNQAYACGPYFHRNRDVCGENNPMFGRTGSTAPAFGRTGEKHPLYGKRGEQSHMFGFRHSEESKQKNRISHLGKSVSENTKQILREKSSGENNAMFGMFGEKSPNFGKKWIYNNETLQNVRIDKNESIPNGWTAGKKQRKSSKLRAKRSEESKKAQSERMKGSRNPFFGKTHTEITKQQIRETKKSQYNKPHRNYSNSDDTIQQRGNENVRLEQNSKTR